MAVKLAAGMGAKVTVLSRSIDKTDDALALGADLLLVSSDTAARAKAQSGFDLIIDTVPVKHDLTPYVSLLDVDGTLVLVGQVGPLDEMNTVPMILGRRRIAGSPVLLWTGSKPRPKAACASARWSKTPTSPLTHALLWPVLKSFLAKYPDILVEVCCDYSFVDIAAQGFDAGVRLGEDVAQGMIATRIGPDMRMAVVASPAYFANRLWPITPRDLTEHQCNNLRLPTNGGLYTWEFKKGQESLNVRVSGQVTFNGVYQLLKAALDGFGLSYIPEDLVAPHIADGRLVQVLEDWCAPFAGFHLYYPSRRQASPAFALLLDALRCAIAAGNCH